jgi:hypothetical protein
MALTVGAALDVVSERLRQLTYVEGLLRNELDARSLQMTGPAFSRWAEGTVAALVDGGLRNEAQRLVAVIQPGWVLQDKVAAARGALESLIEQIHRDPAGLGLKSDPPVAPPPSPPAKSAPDAVTAGLPGIPWPWIPITLAVGIAAGVYGRPAVAAIGSWTAATQRQLARFLAGLVNALQPGPQLPMPLWVGTAAYWLMVGALGVAGGMLVNLLSSDVRRDGARALWQSRRCRVQLLIAVALAAALAALTSR